jgi:hypothetical protein
MIYIIVNTNVCYAVSVYNVVILWVMLNEVKIKEKNGCVIYIVDIKT